MEHRFRRAKRESDSGTASFGALGAQRDKEAFDFCPANVRRNRLREDRLQGSPVLRVHSKARYHETVSNKSGGPAASVLALRRPLPMAARDAPIEAPLTPPPPPPSASPAARSDGSQYEIGAVHRIEVQILDGVVDEVDHLFGADGGRDEAAGREIVFEAVEPGRRASAARWSRRGGRNWRSA